VWWRPQQQGLLDHHGGLATTAGITDKVSTPGQPGGSITYAWKATMSGGFAVQGPARD
jgi:hypothetical protein